MQQIKRTFTQPLRVFHAHGWNDAKIVAMGGTIERGHATFTNEAKGYREAMARCHRTDARLKVVAASEWSEQVKKWDEDEASPCADMLHDAIKDVRVRDGGTFWLIDL